jgi:hypothetical protein
MWKKIATGAAIAGTLAKTLWGEDSRNDDCDDNTQPDPDSPKDDAAGPPPSHGPPGSLVNRGDYYGYYDESGNYQPMDR